MTQTPPTIDPAFPDARRTLAEWDRLNRLAVACSLLDSIGLAIFAPRSPPRPPAPSSCLARETFGVVRAAMTGGDASTAKPLQAAADATIESLRAYESASEARTFARRLTAMTAGFCVHMAFLAAIALAIGNASSEAVPVALIALWFATIVGAHLACSRWVAPGIFAHAPEGSAA